MKKWLALACLLTGTAVAEPQLFVRNQPFEGPVHWFATRTLAPLDGLLESLGCQWQLSGGELRVECGRPSTGGPALHEAVPISLEGRPIRLEQHLQENRVFVDVDQVAEALQCPFRRSSDGNTLDLYAPLLANGLGEGALKGDSSQADFPVTMAECKVVPNGQGEVRGFLRIVNRGQETYTRVLSRVSLYQPGGQLLARFSEISMNLQPGQSAVIQFPPLSCKVANPVARVEFEAR